MASISPLATGFPIATTKSAGQAQFDSTDFSVTEGIVSLGGTGAMESLGGDTGTAAPVGGKINIVGGTNITTTGASPTGDDVSVALDAAIALATSVTSPTYLAPATTDMAITATAGQDIVIKTGDAAAANKISITDTADAEVASIDSDGKLVCVSLNGAAVGDTGASTGAFTTLDSSSDTTCAGDLIVSGAGKGLHVETGAATDMAGQATLVSGTVTVANTNITADHMVILTREGIGASSALGDLDVAITAATNFIITSRNRTTPANTETNDVSIVNYLIVKKI